MTRRKRQKSKPQVNDVMKTPAPVGGVAKAPQPEPAIGRSDIFFMIALVLACALVYSNSLHNGFHLDDFQRIVENPGVHSIHPVWRHFLDPSTSASVNSLQQYRPFLPIALSIGYAFSGTGAAAYHLFNIAAQAVASVFVFLFLISLLRLDNVDAQQPDSAEWIAFLAALIFAIHPISGYAVNYLSAIDLLLMQAFFSMCLYSYVRMRKLGETPARWAGTLVFLMLSLMAKTNAVIAPLLVFFIEFVAAGESLRSRKPWIRVFVFACAVLLFLAWVKFFIHFSDVENVISGGMKEGYYYLLTQIRLYFVHYARNFVWPFQIRALPFVEQVTSPLHFLFLTGFAFLTGTLAIAWACRRRSPTLSFLIFASWTMMLLESSFLPLFQPVSDYRVYPAVPFLALITCLVAFKVTSRRVASLICVALVIWFASASYSMNGNFKDEKSFWGQSVRYGSDCIGTMNYALCFRGENDAIAKKYLELSLQINPDYYLAHINLGLLLIGESDWAGGLEMVKKGVSLSPPAGMDMSLYWLSVADEQVGDTKSAYENIIKALQYNPENTKFLYRAAYFAQSLENYQEALSYLDRLHAIEPNFLLSRYIAGCFLQGMNQPEKAIEQYRLAIRYRPDFAGTYANLGYALLSIGHKQEACSSFERYNALDPSDERVKAMLEKCHAGQGPVLGE